MRWFSYSSKLYCVIITSSNTYSPKFMRKEKLRSLKGFILTSMSHIPIFYVYSYILTVWKYLNCNKRAKSPIEEIIVFTQSITTIHGHAYENRSRKKEGRVRLSGGKGILFLLFCYHCNGNVPDRAVMWTTVTTGNKAIILPCFLHAKPVMKKLSPRFCNASFGFSFLQHIWKQIGLRLTTFNSVISKRERQQLRKSGRLFFILLNMQQMAQTTH